MDVKSVIPGESVTGDESKGKQRSEKKLGSGEQRNLLKMKAASKARRLMMSEPSTKFMFSKRPPPTSVVSGGIKPPKTRKELGPKFMKDNRFMHVMFSTTNGSQKLPAYIEK
ncbi:hypothetical protein SADUNF_Sadunf16G0087300 [Salix dunnii]|uniref:Uncharacterized protein n=1 Tax=Salix dunnii TaxID=1413687 RepID=A0A835J5S9_9ROSI|nr:hypothetical protein SADUNF_Sadunf16G0087300 [Salix dunnii]